MPLTLIIFSGSVSIYSKPIYSLVESFLTAYVTITINATAAAAVCCFILDLLITTVMQRHIFRWTPGYNFKSMSSTHHTHTHKTNECRESEMFSLLIQIRFWFLFMVHFAIRETLQIPKLDTILGPPLFFHSLLVRQLNVPVTWLIWTNAPFRKTF